MEQKIDERLQKAAEEMQCLNIKIEPRNRLSVGFIAGAEWMASQGIVSVTSMMEDDLDDLCPVIADMRHYGFRPGDEVIVQIRKA